MTHSDTPAADLMNASDLHPAILESLPDAVVVTTFSGEVVCLNAAAKRLLGANLNSARGQPLAKILTILDGATRAVVASPLTRFIAHSETRETGELDLLVRRDGKEIPIEVRCTLLRGTRDGVSRGILLTLRDGTGWSELARRATHDPLTRLVNRHEFEQRLEHLLASRRTGEAHALLFMDLNRFKQINDTYGHLAGDSVLRQVAAIFEQLVRSRDTLARIGGDEFALLLQHCPLDCAEEHARALRERLRAQPLQWQEHSLCLDVAIGVVPIAPGARDPAELLAAADRACYAAKHDDRRDWRFPPVASPHKPAIPRIYL